MYDAKNDYEWKHQTLVSYPAGGVVGYTVLDEDDEHTGVYCRTAAGGLFPCRTVSLANPDYASIVAAWMRHRVGSGIEGENLDLRGRR